MSDCDLPPAEKYPGKKYRQNPTGSSDFETKNEWVENEASKWYEKMKDHPKFDSTPIYQKADILKKHLRKLNVAISEARQIIVKIEKGNVSDSESDSEEDENDKESDTEEMDTKEITLVTYQMRWKLKLPKTCSPTVKTRMRKQ